MNRAQSRVVIAWAVFTISLKGYDLDSVLAEADELLAERP